MEGVFISWVDMYILGLFSCFSVFSVFMRVVGISRSKGEEAKEVEENCILRNLNSAPNIITIIKSRRMSQSAYA